MIKEAKQFILFQLRFLLYSRIILLASSNVYAAGKSQKLILFIRGKLTVNEVNDFAL